MAGVSQRQKDVELWRQWDASGRKPEHLKPLFQTLEPLIKSRLNQFKGLQTIPPSALEAELKKKTLDALTTYDPNKNVPLSVHVYNYLKGANKFVYDYQNVARIPGARVRKIGEFQAAFKALESELGRPPTAIELSDRLGWPISEVSRMTTQLRRDLLPEAGTSAESALNRVPSAVREMMELFPYELDPTERAVYEYTFGWGGKPVLGTTQIAKTLKLSPAKVSRTKAKIAKKMQSYLQATQFQQGQFEENFG